jgi:predicted nuclease of predicted toxin-antitoxin system
VHVGEIGLTSTDDLVILERARDGDRALVSADHDFVQILFASGDSRPSVVLVGRFRAFPWLLRVVRPREVLEVA